MLKGIAHLWNKQSDIKVLCRGVIKFWLVSINRDFRRISHAGGSITPGHRVPSGTGAFWAGPGGAGAPQPGRNPGRAEASSACTDFIRTGILHHPLRQPGKERGPHSALPLWRFPCLVYSYNPWLWKGTRTQVLTRPSSRPQRIF